MARPPFSKRDIPEVRILGIEFQWDESNVYNSGTPLFPDASGWVSDPRSHVAYSIASTQEAVQNGTLQIRARFWNSAGKGRIQVRARSVELNPKDILVYELHEKYSGEDALGDIAPATVYFNDTKFSVFRGKHTFVPLKLENVNFPDLGVGIYDINWRWEFRVLDEEASEEKGESVWKDRWHTVRTHNANIPSALTRPFEMTKHRVFITLDSPQHPWSSDKIPDTSLGLPLPLPLWANALEVACNWAYGATTTTEAAMMITQQMYDSGRFVYDPDPHYVIRASKVRNSYQGVKLKVNKDSNVANFQFDKILERLKGGYGLGEKVNCLDCALTVVAMANMLGCQLRAGKLQNSADIDSSDEDHYKDNRFEINPLVAIGKNCAEDSAAVVTKNGRQYFTYHTVAWEGPYGYGSKSDFENPESVIYDACVNFLVDNQQVPASGLPLGNGDTEGSYVNLLARDTRRGRPRCKPQSITVADIQLVC